MPCLRRFLIANRGEIALRVVRACKDLGVTSCIAYSTADRLTAGVEEADERVCIGPRALRSKLPRHAGA